VPYLDAAKWGLFAVTLIAIDHAGPHLVSALYGARRAGRRASRPLRRRGAGEHGQTGLALTRMNAIKHGVSLRLLQAWLVPRWTKVSPARNNASPSSMTA
jgi:hypothetical protein